VRLARELVARCRALNREIAELDQEPKQRTAALAPALLDLPGCRAITAAKLLAEIGPIGRFTNDAQLARHGGVAPLEASSGRIQRHRLDRGGNRQLSSALYRIAITQARVHPHALPRAKANRRQEPTRSHPLPQTTTHPGRLPDLESKPRLDIGATQCPRGHLAAICRHGNPARVCALPPLANSRGQHRGQHRVCFRGIPVTYDPHNHAGLRSTPSIKMRPAGIEPATFRSGGERSIP
jgi:hypothetical protein